MGTVVPWLMTGPVKLTPRCAHVLWTGDLYFRGEGVPKDVKKAKEMWTQAAKLNVEGAQEALDVLDHTTMRQRLSVWIPTFLLLALLCFVMGYFVWKYKEMASESWFQKIQEIKLNDNDNFDKDEAPHGDPSAPE